MTLQEYLAAEGLTGEEIAAIVGNEKQAKAMTKALGLAEEGRTAKAQAEAEKADTAKFWEDKTQELQGSVNRLTAAEKRAATAEAEAARRVAYLKSLKDQGYDVPDEMVAGEHKPAAPQYVTREDLDKAGRATAPDLVSLTKLSNEYAYYYGEPYLNVDEDFDAARKAGKSLGEYARSKYNFEAKKAEKQKAKDEAAYQARYKEDLAKEKEQWATTNGSNPETRSPLPSKFDKLVKQDGFKSDSWKSVEGRKANREARLKKFENSTLQ